MAFVIAILSCAAMIITVALSTTFADEGRREASNAAFICFFVALTIFASTATIALVQLLVNSEDEQEVISMLQQATDAQEKFYQQEGAYASESVDLRLVDPSLDDTEAFEQLKIESSEHENGYFLNWSDGQQRFSLSVKDGMVIDRDCEATALCDDGSWSVPGER